MSFCFQTSFQRPSPPRWCPGNMSLFPSPSYAIVINAPLESRKESLRRRWWMGKLPGRRLMTIVKLISVWYLHLGKKSCSIKVSETFLHSNALRHKKKKKKKKNNLRVSGGSVPLNPTRGLKTSPWTPQVIAHATHSVGATLTSCSGHHI